jgi:hypothetical protein
VGIAHTTRLDYLTKDTTMKLILNIFAIIIATLTTITVSADNEYFYCGYSNIDGTGQDYAKWGKGTDFIYNKDKQRWEWISEYAYQYIYSDGRYEQKWRTPAFKDQIGKCNAEMEKIYKNKIEEIKKKYK